jgi:pimeloyl-ACP methyl ester carboxylesterase
MTDAKPLILLPGMMADHRLLAAQQSAFPNLVVPHWPAHHSSDTLATFAERIAETIRPIGQCAVGGVSFGGIVALELARHLDSSGCILISSIRSPREMPFRFRILRPIGLLPQPAFNALASSATGLFSSSMGRGAKRRSDQMLTSPFFSWAARTTLRWKGCDPGVPIAQIHGEADRTFPVERTRPDHVVSGAGHMLVATHSVVVNEFIRRFQASCDL